MKVLESMKRSADHEWACAEDHEDLDLFSFAAATKKQAGHPPPQQPHETAKLVMREATQAVARAYEEMPHSWARKAVSSRIASDPTLKKIDTKLADQFCQLVDLAEGTDVDLIISRIQEGALCWRTRALKMLEM